MKQKGFTRTNFSQNLRGFTLIELLVVIAIIATILAAAIPNFLGARERAKDTKKKAELQQLKNALRLFYNDYQQFPTSSLNIYINGCGTSTPPTPPSSQCGASFNANGVTYMNAIPDFNGSSSGYGFNFCRVTGGDDYRLWITLDNTSDGDLGTSQTRCSVSCTGKSSWSATEYVVCAD